MINIPAASSLVFIVFFFYRYLPRCLSLSGNACILSQNTRQLCPTVDTDVGCDQWAADDIMVYKAAIRCRLCSDHSRKGALALIP